MDNIYDMAIVGGGPAGVAAGVYAARKKMKTLFLAKQIGGQSIVSDEIGNWIGTIKITGIELAQQLEKHLRAQNNIDINVPEKVNFIEESEKGFELKTDKQEYLAKTAIICSGGRDRRLGVPGEEKFAGRGVSYCSTCDAPFFRGKKVAVVGGGNAGLEAVVDLQPYANEIFLLDMHGKPPGDPATLKEIKKMGKAKIIPSAKAEEIIGDKKVSAIKFKDMENDKTKEVKVDGVFVEIGSAPNSEIVKNLVDTNEKGEIIVEKYTHATSKKGIFAAGDVTDEPFKQNNIAAGDAIKATLAAYRHLLDGRKSKHEEART